MALQAYAAPRQTADLESIMDYLDKPQYWKKFIQTFPDQYDLGLMQKLGMFEEVVGNTTYYWQENDKFISIPVVGSIVDNTGTVTITLGEGSYTDSGTKSYGRVGETIILPNYLSGLITAKSTATPNAHTLTVKPIGTDLTTGAAITSAQLAAGITAGMPLPVETNGFANGSFGQLESVISTISRFSNTLQNLTERYEVNFDQLNTETWVDFPYTAPAVSNFYSAAYNATSTGLLLTGSSAVALDLAADGDNSQGDAVLITKEISTVITDTAKTSVALPVISPLVAYTIYNKGTLALNIFPAVDDYINGLAQDAAYVLAVGAKVTFYAKATAVADTEGFGWNVIS